MERKQSFDNVICAACPCKASSSLQHEQYHIDTLALYVKRTSCAPPCIVSTRRQPRHMLQVQELQRLHALQRTSALMFGLAPPESRGVMEPDLLDVMLRGGAMDGSRVALGVTETGGGVGMPEAAFSKSST